MSNYAPEGTIFYVVVEYPSFICRVQKMIAGTNGKFTQRSDKTWCHIGTYAHAYTDKSLAEFDAKAVNIRNSNMLYQQMKKVTRMYRDLVSYTIGERR